MLQGKSAAITGAASGIGLACARELLSLGARVVLIDRDEEALRRAASDLGDNAFPLRIDLLDGVSVDRMLPARMSAARWRRAIPMRGTGC